MAQEIRFSGNFKTSEDVIDKFSARRVTFGALSQIVKMPASTAWVTILAATSGCHFAYIRGAEPFELKVGEYTATDTLKSKGFIGGFWYDSGSTPIQIRNQVSAAQEIHFLFGIDQ